MRGRALASSSLFYSVSWSGLRWSLRWVTDHVLSRLSSEWVRAYQDSRTTFPLRSHRETRGVREEIPGWISKSGLPICTNSARDVRVKQSSEPPISQQFLTGYLLEMRGEQHFLCFQFCVREPWWRFCRTPTLIQIENVNFLPLSTPSRLHWLPWPGGKECKINLLADDGGMALLGRLNGNSWLTGENGDQEDRTEFQGWLATLPWWSI